jgi:hypothetical protein
MRIFGVGSMGAMGVPVLAQAMIAGVDLPANAMGEVVRKAAHLRAGIFPRDLQTPEATCL